MQTETLEAIRAHAARDYPREACGLVIIERGREVYVPCTNSAVSAIEHFVLRGDEYADAEDRGEVIAIVHSHPDASATPSQADRVSCEESRLPWHIVSWPHGELHTLKPCGYEAPLVGRRFVHGVLDCWSLVRDWYARERGIHLPDFERHDGWWNDGASDLYTEHLLACGATIVWQQGDPVPQSGLPLEVGDVIQMQIRSRNGVPNHAGVYVGDGRMLHHLYERLSTRDVYGGYWQECTRRIVRHSG